MSLLKPLAVGASSRITRRLMAAPRMSGSWLVIEEFPKSGGTWLARLMASLVNWPFLDQSVLPPGGSAVLRVHHATPDSVARRIYLVRDPRDVFVSLFHHRVAHWQSNGHYRRRWHAQHAAALDTDRIREQFSDFIRFEHETVGERGSGTSMTWGQHVRHELDRSPDPRHRRARISYEALRNDGIATLTGAYDALFAHRPHPDLVRAVLQSQEIGLRRGAATDVSASKSIVRSGSVGGWRDVVDGASARLIDELYGTQMVRLGYEREPDPDGRVP